MKVIISNRKCNLRSWVKTILLIISVLTLTDTTEATNDLGQQNQTETGQNGQANDQTPSTVTIVLVSTGSVGGVMATTFAIFKFLRSKGKCCFNIHFCNECCHPKIHSHDGESSREIQLYNTNGNALVKRESNLEGHHVDIISNKRVVGGAYFRNEIIDGNRHQFIQAVVNIDAAPQYSVSNMLQ